MNIYHLHYIPNDGHLFFVEHPKDMFEYKSELLEFLEKKLGTDFEGLHDWFYEYFINKKGNDCVAYDLLQENRKEYIKQFENFINYKMSWKHFFENNEIFIYKRKLID